MRFMGAKLAKLFGSHKSQGRNLEACAVLDEEEMVSALATYRGRWTPAHAAHLLNRAGFGGTPEEIDRATRTGLAGTVDALLAPEAEPYPAPPPPLPAPMPPRRQLRELSEEQRQQVRRAHRMAVADIRQWWIQRMVEGSQPLAEKMTLFWHGHFATAARDVNDARLVFRQHQLLRQHALGSFRDLLHGIARDPAMLRFLDNDTSRHPRPNENFARELLELFTLGLGAYTEEDVRAAACAFTGWSVEGEEFRFRPAWHDGGTKTFLGRTGNLDGGDVVDALLEHPGTARFVVRKLLVFFVGERPDEAVVEALAHAWRAGSYELRPLLRRIFQSELFYSPSVWRTQIKSPVQLVVGTVRLLGLRVPAGLLAQQMRELGQDLLDPPSVKGWDEGEAWINSNTLLRRYHLLTTLWAKALVPGGDAADRDPVQTVGDRRSEEVSNRLAHLVTKEVSVEPELVVDTLLWQLLPISVPMAVRQALVEQARTVPSRDRARVVAHLIVSMPEYQLC